MSVFAGWGRVAAGRDARGPARAGGRAAGDLAAAGAEGIIVHAGGRSYGDAALNAGGRAILTRRLDRLLEFDPASGLLAAEAGVTFDDLRRLFLPRGFLAPVTPGTAFATLGGAVANDVHGKNQDQAGNFGGHVAWLDLMLPSGEVRRLTAADPLFRATVGGLGLTGVILALAFRMMAVPSRFVALRERRVADLDEFLAVLEIERRQADYSVGWIDALARGRRSAAASSRRRSGRRLSRRITSRGQAPALPLDLPGFALNPLSIAAFNALYWRRVPRRARAAGLPTTGSSIPWTPSPTGTGSTAAAASTSSSACCRSPSAAAGVRAMLETCAASRAASFLAVLKTMGREGWVCCPSAAAAIRSRSISRPRRASTICFAGWSGWCWITAGRSTSPRIPGWRGGLRQHVSRLPEFRRCWRRSIRPAACVGPGAPARDPGDDAAAAMTGRVSGSSSAPARPSHAPSPACAAGGADIILAGRDLADMERSAADVRMRGAARSRCAGSMPPIARAMPPSSPPSAPATQRPLGFGLLHPQEAIDRDPSLAEQVIAVNYQGAVSILSRPRSAARRGGAGAVVVLSSVAGDRGRPSNYVYGSARQASTSIFRGFAPGCPTAASPSPRSRPDSSTPP